MVEKVGRPVSAERSLLFEFRLPFITEHATGAIAEVRQDPHAGPDLCE
jgi:hypothetical protein